MTAKRKNWRDIAPLSDDVPAQWAKGKHPIRKLGKPPSGNFTMVPNELIRDGIAIFGSDAYSVLSFLMSHESGWATSADDMSETMRLGLSGSRVSKALKALVADRRVVLCPHVRIDGGGKFHEYVIHADGSRLTDGEFEKWSQPVESAGRGSRKQRRAE